jgi:hypothetical protein
MLHRFVALYFQSGATTAYRARVTVQWCRVIAVAAAWLAIFSFRIGHAKSLAERQDQRRMAQYCGRFASSGSLALLAPMCLALKIEESFSQIRNRISPNSALQGWAKQASTGFMRKWTPPPIQPGRRGSFF